MSPLSIAGAFLSGALVVWAIDAARRMSPATCHKIRAGVVLIGASAIAQALAPLYGRAPEWIAVAMMFGVALVLWSERRRRH